MSTMTGDPHRRFNPLTDEWVLVSPGRSDRPWQGREERPESSSPLAYDPECHLCPGNRRVTGKRNPDYIGPFVFDNDFGALAGGEPGEADGGAIESGGLLRAKPVSGVCRVVCFSPRHDASLGGMPDEEVRQLIDEWAHQSVELGAKYPWVQVFENRGAAMGASNPHPHGQVWAVSELPTLAALEQRTQAAYLADHGRPMLGDYLAEEDGGERTVAANDEWLVVVPFWAAWPFETLLLPRRPAISLLELDDVARDQLAEILRRLVGTYDRLFDVPFPYSMGWHQAPFGEPADGWQLHGHVYPPLLRSATVRKFMVGYELLSEIQRDVSPEDAAERLRLVGDQSAS
jgi:UDPglucose--hexose-1-phosphate uridylyltransferase